MFSVSPISTTLHTLLTLIPPHPPYIYSSQCPSPLLIYFGVISSLHPFLRILLPLSCVL